MFYSRIVIIIVFILFIKSEHKVTPLYFNIPVGFPTPKYDFEENPLSLEIYTLGKKLFHDPILSRNNTVSCSSCHLQETSFTHVDHSLSHGIDDQFGKRNSPALINLAWMDKFMWDGRIDNIHLLAISPINDPLEMDESLENIKYKLKNNFSYRELFENAYGDDEITNIRLLKALSQYMLMLVSANSKYDEVKKGLMKFNDNELKGYNLFKLHCSSCHQEPLFTNNSFENNGLMLDSKLLDYGVFSVTNKKEDKLKFKVPSLRNLSYSFPYMHDGRFKTISEVIDFYNDKKDKNEFRDNSVLESIFLSKEDELNLISFLKTLDDKQFTRNEFYSNR